MSASAYSCDLVEPAPVVLAVSSAVVTRTEIPQRIIPLFDLVYAWLRAAEVEQVGHNHALYLPEESGLRMQAGVPVSARFEDTDTVRCIPLAVQRAARTVHRGEYGELGSAYAALGEWCRAEGLRTTELSWEVYGDWDDDPEKRITEVFLELAEP